MVNAQEWLDQNYPKERNCLRRNEAEWLNNFGKTRIDITKLSLTNQDLSGHLDLSDFVNLESLYCSSNKLTSLDLSNCENLESLYCSSNKLTSLDLSNCENLESLYCYNSQLISVDFLNNLPHPEKLKKLLIYDNNIQPTKLDFLLPFVNLKDCKIGENMSKFDIKLRERLQQKTYNKFYGSLEPIKNLTKLEQFCIAGTDVEEGIECIPLQIAELSKEKGEEAMNLNLIDCQPLREDAKVAKIKNELRAFDYDISAWQLAHPEKMLIARPELFTNPDSKDKWIEALKNKIKTSQEALDYLLQNEPNKEAKIIRLETQIKILKEVENQLKKEMEEEREIHEDAMKAMDNFYQQNPPREDLRLKNILQQFEEKYLKLNKENKQKEQKIKELERTIETVEKMTEQEYQPKETEEKETQTELTKEVLENQQRENKELREQIRKLTLKS